MDDGLQEAAFLWVGGVAFFNGLDEFDEELVVKEALLVFLVVVGGGEDVFGDLAGGLVGGFAPGAVFVERAEVFVLYSFLHGLGVVLVAVVHVSEFIGVIEGCGERVEHPEGVIDPFVVAGVAQGDGLDVFEPEGRGGGA